MAIPTAANPTLADLLEWYCTHRSASCEKFYNNPSPTALWSFAPYENSSDWHAAATLSAWLLDAYTAVGATPPSGFKWTSHSLRKGAASAASCIGAPLHFVKYMGGWASNSFCHRRKIHRPHHDPISNGVAVLRLARPRQTALSRPGCANLRLSRYWQNVPSGK
jgi:hypothetical protein